MCNTKQYNIPTKKNRPKKEKKKKEKTFLPKHARRNECVCVCVYVCVCVRTGGSWILKIKLNNGGKYQKCWGGRFVRSGTWFLRLFLVMERDVAPW